MTDTLRFHATCEIQAAAGKPARVSILAYDGAPMRVPGWPSPIVLESSALALGPVTLLSDHDTSRRGVIGNGTATARTGGEIDVEGTISRSSEAGREIIALAKDGVRWQSSVGVDPNSKRIEWLRAGETATANGRTYKAGPEGLAIIRAGTLREISIVALGAATRTAVDIAASKKGQQVMPPESENTETRNNAPSAIEAESIRINRINALFADRDWSHVSSNAEALRASAIAEGRQPHELAGELQNLRELQEIRAGRSDTGGMGIVRRQEGSAPNRQMLEASLMIRAGNEELAVKCFGEQTAQQARDLGISSMLEFCRAGLALDPSKAGEAYGRSDSQMIRAAFSTVSVPNILSNVMGRTLEAAYTESTASLRLIATVKSAANFKPQKSIRPSSMDSLEEVGPGGEIKHSQVKEEDLYPWQIGTFAKMVGITRQDIINDDLGFFSDLPMMLAQAAARTLLDLVWSTWLGGQSAGFFDAGNGNLLTTGSALGIGSLGTAIQTFRKQRDSKGNDINISPAALIVPAPLETTARPLLNSTEVLTIADAITPNGNPVRGIVPNLLVPPQLSNDDKFSGASDTAWYLCGGPASGALLLGFLNGRQSPVVETEDAPFNTLGIQIRCYHDFGVALGDPKAALKATGEAGGG